MSADTPPHEDHPELHAQFEVVKKLGDGAAATVYHVRHKKDGKDYALKILTNEQAFDNNTIERFREELRICRQIRHANLVEAYELLTLDGSPAYLMEFIEGADLSSLFTDKGFSPKQITSLYHQLLPAIRELHLRGVLHRDIKLENILVRKDGTVKLSDLGLMKQYSKDLTATGVILGTAHYLPPEYVRDGRYDIRSEIYVLGTMLFEMLSGKRWLSHLKGAQALEHLIKTNFAFPIESIPNLDIRFRYLLQKSLAFNPNQRFQTVDEMLKAFDEDPPSPEAQAEEKERIQTTLDPEVEEVNPRAEFRLRLLLLLTCVLTGILVALGIGWFLRKRKQ